MVTTSLFPALREAEAGQPELHSKTLSQKEKKRNQRNFMLLMGVQNWFIRNAGVQVCVCVYSGILSMGSVALLGATLSQGPPKTIRKHAFPVFLGSETLHFFIRLQVVHLRAHG